jgi:hypothetical protein
MLPKKPEATGGRQSVSGQTGSDHQEARERIRSQARHSSLSRMSVRLVAIHTRTPDAMEIIATVHQPAPRPRPSASQHRPRR